MKSRIGLVLSVILLCLFIIGCASSGESQTSERETTDADVDLTVLSATVLSAEMMNIFVNSDDYLGKTIKVSGTYWYVNYPPTGENHHYVITVQGDECCQEGIEFVLSGDHVFPDDYPAMGTPIEISGVFSRDNSEGIRILYLATDHIHVLG